MAKVFMNGRSQAARLPAKYRFSCREVFVEQRGDALVLRPKPTGWDDFFARKSRVPEGALRYFCGEGEESQRIDLCDACRHYIKTIDCCGLEDPDPCLEDLATLHLDVVAVQKGYARPVANPWTSHEAG